MKQRYTWKGLTPEEIKIQRRIIRIQKEEEDRQKRQQKKIERQEECIDILGKLLKTYTTLYSTNYSILIKKDDSFYDISFLFEEIFADKFRMGWDRTIRLCRNEIKDLFNIEIIYERIPRGDWYFLEDFKQEFAL